MIPLTQLKKDLEFNVDLRNVINAMKGIAVGKFQTHNRALKRYEEFSSAAEEIISSVNLAEVNHPLARGSSGTAAILMITSDGGFLGGLNSQVIGRGLKDAGESALLTVVGERGAAYLRDSQRKFKLFPRAEAADDFNLAVKLRDQLLDYVFNWSCTNVTVVYPAFISLASQKVNAETLIPCSKWVRESKDSEPSDIIWESTPMDVLSYSVAQWMTYKLAQILTLSRLAELAARVTHLEGSHQELERRTKALKKQYFHSRHELIDRNMREVFSSQLLLTKNTEDTEEEIF